MTNKEEKKGPQLLDVTDETFEGAKQVRLFLTTHHADRHLLDYHDTLVAIAAKYPVTKKNMRNGGNL